MTRAAAEVGALDALGQAELVRSGEVSPTELVTWAVERIEELNPTLNAVVTPMYERALDAAKVAPSGPFVGVPYLVKDLVTEVGRRAVHRRLTIRQRLRLPLRLRAGSPVTASRTRHPRQDQYARVWHGSDV